MKDNAESKPAENSGLTIIIPVYNRAERVKHTLRSLSEQTLRPLEIVLVDNNSTDGTLEVLRRWQQENDSDDFRIKVVREEKAGAAAARNRGLQLVTTRYTMFFDSDDIMLPGHCQRAMDGFRCHPQADIVGWDCFTVFPSGQRRKAGFYSRDLIWNNMFLGGMATQRYAARTDIFHRAGLWNESCMGWDDVEFGMRILLLSPSVVKLKGDATVRIVATAESITGRDFSSKAPVWEHSLDLMEASARKVGGADAARMARMVNFRRVILAGDYLREGNRRESRRLLDTAQAAESSAVYRMLNRLAVFYRGKGLPGFFRLVRWMF